MDREHLDQILDPADTPLTRSLTLEHSRAPLARAQVGKGGGVPAVQPALRRYGSGPKRVVAAPLHLPRSVMRYRGTEAPELLIYR